ncbi:MAG: hypothetical protein IT438_06260 [Phycisphaerales bacterium]|nr:hypothetical protein [Phycisphaerales bacterium]
MNAIATSQRIDGRSGVGRLSAAAVLTVALGGCAAHPEPVAREPVRGQAPRREVTAAYSGGTLKTSLDPAFNVLVVHAAAESALRARGYSITSSTGSADHARITARSAGSGVGLRTILGDIAVEQVVVDTVASSDSTDMRVRFEPWGDEPRSRAVMDAVLTRLRR